jgi:hypothetical protein
MVSLTIAGESERDLIGLSSFHTGSRLSRETSRDVK